MHSRLSCRGDRLKTLLPPGRWSRCRARSLYRRNLQQELLDPRRIATRGQHYFAVAYKALRVAARVLTSDSSGLVIVVVLDLVLDQFQRVGRGCLRNGGGSDPVVDQTIGLPCEYKHQNAARVCGFNRIGFAVCAMASARIASRDPALPACQASLRCNRWTAPLSKSPLWMRIGSDLQ